MFEKYIRKAAGVSDLEARLAATEEAALVAATRSNTAIEAARVATTAATNARQEAETAAVSARRAADTACKDALNAANAATERATGAISVAVAATTAATNARQEAEIAAASARFAAASADGAHARLDALKASYGLGTPANDQLARLIANMTQPNEGGSYLASPPLKDDMTADKHGPNGTWAYIQHGIRAAAGDSYWPKRYLDNAFGLSSTDRVKLLMWYVVCRMQSQAPGLAMNTRAWLGNARTVLLMRDGQYRQGGRSLTLCAGDSTINANWHASFSSPGNEKTQKVDKGVLLHQSAAVVDGVTVGGIGQGVRQDWALHGWPVGDELTFREWVDNVAGVIQLFDGELRLHDPRGPDDRDQAGLGVWIGDDWWHGDRYLGEHHHGRIQTLTQARKTFSSTSIPIEVLRNNPPPASLLA